MGAKKHGLGKRVLAALLSLPAPGVGHYLLGQTRVGVILCASLTACAALLFAACSSGVLTLFWVSASLTIAVQCLLVVHAFTVRRGTSPATWKVVIATLAVVLGLQTMLFLVNGNVGATFQVPSASMYPDLPPGTQLFVSKLDRSARTGDVVAYVRPRAEDIYLKRVVGRAGDRIEIRRHQVLVNGKPLPQRRSESACVLEKGCEIWTETLGDRSYEVALSPDSYVPNGAALVVPENSVFVLGDFRNNSFDSRHHGPVPLANVVGKVSLVWWRSEPERP